MSKSFKRNFLSRLSLKSSRSAPILVRDQHSDRMKTIRAPTKTESSPSHIKSAVVLNNQNPAQESRQHLDAMHKMVDQTDQDLRCALERAAIRREQLDDLHSRSEEMLTKNENFVFGITNYRKTQERDLFWRRFRYVAIGAVTLGMIILLIILSMTSKQAASTPQVIDIRHSSQDLQGQNNHEKAAAPPPLEASRRRRRRRRKREILADYSLKKFKRRLIR